MAHKILIVEDDIDLTALIRVNLSELGVEIVHASDGQEALNLALAQEFDLLLLDITLPTISGLDICRTVRQQKPAQAIIMLTAKDSETDRVLGLELGADDYMTKPFSVRELQARVRVQLRKVDLVHQLASQAQSEDDEQAMTLGSFSIDARTREVKKSGQCLELTATEFDLLFYMAKRPNRVFTRSQLLESVWGYAHSGYEHTVNSHINRLRAKVEDNANLPKIVQTVWGVGYKFNPDGASEL